MVCENRSADQRIASGKHFTERDGRLGSAVGLFSNRFHPDPMDTRTYPGKGLSLSQLVFALKEELKHVAYSPLYVAKDHYGLATS